jgi:hypothetical protein
VVNKLLSLDFEIGAKIWACGEKLGLWKVNIFLFVKDLSTVV